MKRGERRCFSFFITKFCQKNFVFHFFIFFFQVFLGSLLLFFLSFWSLCDSSLNTFIMTDTPPGGGPQLPQRWGAALGNIADASIRAETLSDAVDKALWLDEGALEAAAPAAQTAERLNVSGYVCCWNWEGKRGNNGRREGERRMNDEKALKIPSIDHDLNLNLNLPPHAKTKTKKQTLIRKLLDLKSQLDDARSLAAAAEDARRAAEREAEEMREERDNARASLAAHVAELVERGEECARLRSVVEELTRALGGDGDGEEGARRRRRGGVGSKSSNDDNDNDDNDDDLPSAPKGDTKAKARDARTARDLASLEAEKLAAEMISAAEEESRGGDNNDDAFSSLT